MNKDVVLVASQDWRGSRRVCGGAEDTDCRRHSVGYTLATNNRCGCLYTEEVPSAVFQQLGQSEERVGAVSQQRARC